MRTTKLEVIAQAIISWHLEALFLTVRREGTSTPCATKPLLEGLGALSSQQREQLVDRVYLHARNGWFALIVRQPEYTVCTKSIPMYVADSDLEKHSDALCNLLTVFALSDTYRVAFEKTLEGMITDTVILDFFQKNLSE